MADNPLANWRPIIKRRLVVVAVLFGVWAAGVEARLVFLQVFRHDDLAARAERQQQRTAEAPAERGEILDRHGRTLAYSVDADSIYAVPSEIGDPAAASGALCGALGDCDGKDRQALIERLRRGRAFVYVRRQVTPDQAKRVADLQLDGIGFMKESRRFYPNKELGSHLLGYVGIDNAGLGGIEAAYDNLIRGRAGTVLIQTDARRHAFSRVEKPPTSGASLELTIDEYLQHVAERELKAGVEWSGGASGSAIVMDPHTGEILAMASYPAFNPNAYGESTSEARRNRAIQDLYEPGSTFKIVTAGAALEEKLLTPDSPIETSPGTIRFGSRVIGEDKHHNYGSLTFTGVIVKSSNVGAVKIGLRVGAERLSDYVKRFGFGRTTSPDFRGENSGIVWPAAKLNDSALASMSMGHQVGVTPLQMASAVSVVANGGELLRPRLVRAVIRDGQRIPVPRKVVNRAISAETAAELTGIMEKVVTDGTGKPAQIAGFTVAGKTGTAQKVVNRRYSNSDYMVSFVGFVPSRKPLFTIVVVVDSPHKVPAYGSVVAAPIFQRIATAALRQYGVPPSLNAPPAVLVARHDERPEQPTSGPVELVTPAPHDGQDAPADLSHVPDVRGLSARDALRVLAKMGIPVRMQGTGFVLNQQPAAGTPLEPGVTSVLYLGRHPAERLASVTRP